MPTFSRAIAHPDIGENGRQPADGTVSWSELRRADPIPIARARRVDVANTNRPAVDGQGDERRAPAAFGFFDR